jgi:hypothetical protein
LETADSKHLKTCEGAWSWWITSEIQVPWEGDIQRTAVQSQSRQKALETPSQQKKLDVTVPARVPPSRETVITNRSEAEA